MWKVRIKLKSTDIVLTAFVDAPKDLDPTYKFWRFQEENGREKWIAVNDVCYLETWKER